MTFKDFILDVVSNSYSYVYVYVNDKLFEEGYIVKLNIKDNIKIDHYFHFDRDIYEIYFVI